MALKKENISLGFPRKEQQKDQCFLTTWGLLEDQPWMKFTIKKITRDTGNHSSQ